MNAVVPPSMDPIAWQIITSLVSGTVFSAILGVFFHRRLKTLEARLSEELQRNVEVFRSTRAWQQAAISELFGPMVMQFNRTRRAFDRYRGTNLYLEAKVLAEGNATIKSLLLSHAHLIPADQFDDAGKLIEHYDVWLEEFETQRQKDNPLPQSTFIFAGPQGYPFPTESENRLIAAFHHLREQVYGVKAPPTPRS